MADAIRVLVVDDHPVVRQGLRSFLGSRPGISVVGEASDGEEAVDRAQRLDPDVVLMDLVMSPVGGVEAIRRIMAARPSARILVLTSFASDSQVLPAIQAGAAGYLLKDVDPPDLEAAIRAVHAGEAALDSQVAGRVMAQAAGTGSVNRGPSLLTRRELEVLRLLAEGLSNRELAGRLVVSEKTVKTHVSSILTKLQLSDRTQAALFAVRHGLAGETDAREP